MKTTTRKILTLLALLGFATAGLTARAQAAAGADRIALASGDEPAKEEQPKEEPKKEEPAQDERSKDDQNKEGRQKDPPKEQPKEEQPRFGS